MTLPGPVPQPNDSVGDQFKAIWQYIRELERRKLYSVSISEGGLVIQDGATFQVLHSSGVPLLTVARDGTGKYFVAIYRADGTPTFVTQTHSNNEQFWSLWDRETNGILVSDDAGSGWGLANPKLTGVLYPSRWADMLTTTSTSYEELFRGEWRQYNPYIRVALWAGSSEATTPGHVRVMVNGVEKWSTAIAAFSLAAVSTPDILVTAGHIPGDTIIVTVEAKVDSGPGEIRVSPMGVPGAASP